jgi:hypothetical protein
VGAPHLLLTTTVLRTFAALLGKVDDVRKVDTSNPQQMERLHDAFSHNMAAVDFWLRFCVLPAETRQFTQRLSASAWHLVTGAPQVPASSSTNGDGGGDSNVASNCRGFSGTNDNQLLLPLGVKQADVPGQPLLAATNGKMLDMLLRTASYATLARRVGQAAELEALR